MDVQQRHLSIYQNFHTEFRRKRRILIGRKFKLFTSIMGSVYRPRRSRAAAPGQQDPRTGGSGPVAARGAFPGGVAGGRSHVAISARVAARAPGKAPGSAGSDSALNRPDRGVGYLGLLHPNPGRNKTTWSLSVPGCGRREVPSACTDSLSSRSF